MKSNYKYAVADVKGMFWDIIEECEACLGDEAYDYALSHLVWFFNHEHEREEISLEECRAAKRIVYHLAGRG